jgi:hypothetical protein
MRSLLFLRERALSSKETETIREWQAAVMANHQKEQMTANSTVLHHSFKFYFSIEKLLKTDLLF